ncbi:hypothetical protein [Vibrio gallicus]|uniref:hypothetical protein n=1 Tax=Vibrio gallicus TaxID=190897 RepID=UPI0021C3546A|nr:hypothetical protein [Vibrio gallicus]
MSWAVVSDLLSIILLVILAVALLRAKNSLIRLIAITQKTEGGEEETRKQLAKLSMNRFIVVITVATIAVKTALLLGALVDLDAIDKNGLLDDSIVQYVQD